MLFVPQEETFRRIQPERAEFIEMIYRLAHKRQQHLTIKIPWNRTQNFPNNFPRIWKDFRRQDRLHSRPCYWLKQGADLLKLAVGDLTENKTPHWEVPFRSPARHYAALNVFTHNVRFLNRYFRKKLGGSGHLNLEATLPPASENPVMS